MQREIVFSDSLDGKNKKGQEDQWNQRSFPAPLFINQHHFFDRIKRVCKKLLVVEKFLPWHTKEEGVSEGCVLDVIMITFFILQKASIVWLEDEDSSLLVTYFDPLEDMVTISNERFCCEKEEGNVQRLLAHSG